MENKTAVVLDITVLAELKKIQRPGRPDIVKTVIGLFLQSSPEIAQQIRTAYKAKDLSALSDTSHSLKSSAASIGALRLAEICFKLEHHLNEHPPKENLEELMKNFELEYASAYSVLQALEIAA